MWLKSLIQIGEKIRKHSKNSIFKEIYKYKTYEYEFFKYYLN